MATQVQIDTYLEKGILWISNDPQLGYKRAFRFKLIFDPFKKEIWLDGEITFHNEDETLLNSVRFKPYWKTLIADKKLREDGTTEYDYFVETAREPIQIFELIIDTALFNDSKGKFNV